MKIRHKNRVVKLRKVNIHSKLKIGKWGKRLLYLTLFTIVVLCILFIKSPTENWTGNNKLFLVTSNKDGSINVISFNPVDSEIINIHIPGNTEVEVAHQLGLWKLRSIWQLGKQEQIGGSLLTSTIAKNFKFPVYLWSSESGISLLSSKTSDLIQAVIIPYESNLGLRDKIHLALFSLGVKNSKRIDIELLNTKFLKKTVLKDGEEGYVITGNVPKDLISAFSGSQFSQMDLKIMIRDRSDSPALAEDIGKIVEVFGGKVSSIVREPGQDIGCFITGKNKSFIKSVLKVLPCNDAEHINSNFDLEMVIGRNFNKDF